MLRPAREYARASNVFIWYINTTNYFLLLTNREQFTVYVVKLFCEIRVFKTNVNTLPEMYAILQIKKTAVVSVI